MNDAAKLEVEGRLTDALNDAIRCRATAPFCHMAAHIRKNKLEKPGAAPAGDVAAVKLLPEVQAYLEEHAIERKLGEVVSELLGRAGVPDDLPGLLAAKVGLLETKSLLPLLQMPGFWEKEGGAPLLGRNAGFLTSERGVPEAWRERVAKWPSLCDGAVDPSSDVCDDEAALRIFEKDADRTFVDAMHKQLYIGLLMRVWPENRDYNQGLGYTCSLLMLLFDEATIVRLLTAFTRSDKYTPGYWRAAPDAYVRDAWVYGRLLKEREPEVAALLAVCVPESYASKWFNGLCLHVLPYEALFPFVEQFIVEGYGFLFKFALALIGRVKGGLLQCAQTQVNTLYEHLRLDAKLYPDDKDGGAWFVEMVEEAKAVELDVAAIASMRKEEEERLAEHRRKVAEREAEYSDDEIVFSDEEDD